MKMQRLLILLLGLILSTQAHAEANEVRIVMPYGLGYLPTYVAVDNGLIQKHAKAAGLGDVKVTLQHMASGPASSDLLLAGDADLAMGGYGPAFVLWDKARGAQKVRVVTPLSSSPIWVLSNDPRIKTIKDFGPTDRIAVSAVKLPANGRGQGMGMGSAVPPGCQHGFDVESGRHGNAVERRR
jgi:NitT/TauT family transport system substrate-binding protein